MCEAVDDESSNQPSIGETSSGEPKPMGESNPDEWVESPMEFYRRFTQRPDVQEIMRRLADWPPGSAERPKREE
jgi:hypothetical protein